MTRTLLAGAVPIACLACSHRSPDFAITASLRTPLATSMLHVLATTPGQRWQITGADLDPAGTGTLASATMETATSGQILVSVAFIASNGDTIATGSVSALLGPDTHWIFGITADSLNPVFGCFGCGPAKAFRLAPAYQRSPTDSLWIAWHNNVPPPKGVIF